MSFNFFSLDYVYYPVSGILKFWHWIFGGALGDNNGWAWVLSVVFLVFTLRGLLFKPFLKQMNSQQKMQAIQPQIKKLKEKYKDDRPRLTEEMMKLNKEAGVNPISGCLPALIQAPVFIGLYHVLRLFKPGWHQIYFLNETDINSFVNSKLFHGAPLSSYMTMPTYSTAAKLGLMSNGSFIGLGGIRSTIIAVGIPLCILAGIATHLSSRRSVARQQQMTPGGTVGQAAIMNKLMLWVFPLFVVVGGPFFPLATLFYWLSNNTWTFGQLWVAHRMQDRKAALVSQVVEEAKESTKFSKPPPGARPSTGSKRTVIQPSPLIKDSGSTVTPTKPATKTPTSKQPNLSKSPVVDTSDAPVSSPTRSNPPTPSTPSTPSTPKRKRNAAANGSAASSGSAPLNGSGAVNGSAVSNGNGGASNGSAGPVVNGSGGSGSGSAPSSPTTVDTPADSPSADPAGDDPRVDATSTSGTRSANGGTSANGGSTPRPRVNQTRKKNNRRR